MLGDKMNSKERILKTMGREDTDYIPCSPFFNNQDYVQRIGKKWQPPFGPSQEERIHYFKEIMDLDPIVSVPWSRFEESPGVKSRSWMEGSVIHKEYETPAGIISAAIKYSDQWPHGLDIPFYSDYNIAHFIKPWLEDNNDLECLKFILTPPHSDRRMDQIEFQVTESKRTAERYGLATMVFAGQGLTGAIHLCGAEQACFMTVEQPDLLKGFLELEHECTKENYRIAIDMGIDILRRNGFYESTDFFSPAVLEDFISHQLKELCSLVHRENKKIGYTILTGAEQLTGYLGEAGFDCLMCPDPFFRGADPEKLKRDLGQQMSFWTGPSDTVHMPWENPEKVREAVRETIRIYGPKGLIITPCSSAKAVFPWANFEAMVDEWKKLR
jgi:hypothetical protein